MGGTLASGRRCTIREFVSNAEVVVSISLIWGPTMGCGAANVVLDEFGTMLTEGDSVENPRGVFFNRSRRTEIAL